jgi:hypothetical protein
MSTFPGFNKDQLIAIKQQAIDFWNTASSDHDKFFKNTSDRERMAHCKLPIALENAFRSYPDRSCLAPPDMFVNISSLRAAISNLAYGSKPYGLLSHFGDKEFADETIRKAEWVLQYQNDIAQDAMDCDMAVHQALYGGMSCVFTGWEAATRRVVPRDEYGEQLVDKKGATIITEEVYAKYSRTIAHDIRRVRIDPSCDRIEDRRIVGRHYIKQESDLLKINKSKNHYYSFDVEELKKSTFPTDKYYEFVRGESDAIYQKGKVNETFGDRIVEIKEIRGIFRVKRVNVTVFEDLIVHIANDTVLVGVKKNDLPMHGWELYDFPVVDQEMGRLFPMGVLEPAQDLWFYLFLVMNNFIDRNHRTTYDMYLADASAISGFDDYISFEQGKIIKIDTMATGLPNVGAAFQPLAKPQQSQEPVLLMAKIQDMIQQVMRLSDYLQGTNPGRAETATAVEALMQGGQSLLMYLMANLKRSLYAKTWQKKLILWNHFRGHQQFTAKNGEGIPMQVQPNEINTLWQVDIDTNANRDRPSMTRRLIELFPMLSSNPAIDQKELVTTAVNVLQLPNKDRLIIDDQHVEFIADRENAALAEGVPQPVHPADKHERHHKTHSEFLQNAEGLSQAALQAVQQHDEEHLEFLRQAASGLGNSKELGGNVGQSGSPGNPSITQSKVSN